MKRDCGERELIVTKYKVSWHKDSSDREKTKFFDLFEEAHVFYKDLILQEFGNKRLYACDDEGYCNCVLSISMLKGFTPRENTNRLSEL